MFDFELRGIDEAISRTAKAEQAVAPDGGLRTVMRLATGQLHRYIIGQPPAIMRVDTGRLKNSIFPDVRTQGREVFGLVATNVEYAPPVEDRYGFFARGVSNQKDAINSLFADYLGKAIKWR